MRGRFEDPDLDRLVTDIDHARVAITIPPKGISGRHLDEGCSGTCCASGWTNGEIAAWLSIAPTTVKSHVSHTLAKIGVRARVQAVTFAYESGRVRPAA